MSVTVPRNSDVLLVPPTSIASTSTSTSTSFLNMHWLPSSVTLPRALFGASLLALMGGMYWWRFSSNAVNSAASSSAALAEFGRQRALGTKSNIKTDALAELGYKFGLDGILVEIASGKKFIPKNAAHFEMVAERAMELVHKDLYRDFEEVWLPIGALPQNGNNIFVTPDWQTNETILVVIQGAGVERPGVWSRQLLLTESRAFGSMDTVIEEAVHRRSWATVILNPNLTHIGKGTLKAAIQGSETPEKHTQYVYDSFLSKARAKRVFVLAVGNGARCAVHLLRNRTEFAASVTACAFVNSLHSVDSDTLHMNSLLKDVLAEKTQNWVASNTPLGTLVNSPFSESNGCLNISAGVERNLLCLPAVTKEIFAFFDRVTVIPRSRSQGDLTSNEGALKRSVSLRSNKSESNLLRDIEQQSLRQLTPRKGPLAQGDSLHQRQISAPIPTSSTNRY